MSVKAATPGPVLWVLSGILCACTLAALLVTAVQIKARKMAARYGERIETVPAAPDGGAAELVIRRGQSARVEHLRLSFPESSDTLEVRDAQERALVRFTGLQTGQERGWQELRLKLLEVRKDELRLAAEFLPGSPCYGSGIYVALKTGLRIDFPGGRRATVVLWDPPTARIKVESSTQAEEQSIAPEESRPILGLTLTLHRGELSISE